MGDIGTEERDEDWARTRAWVESGLPAGSRIAGVEALRGAGPHGYGG